MSYGCCSDNIQIFSFFTFFIGASKRSSQGEENYGSFSLGFRVQSVLKQRLITVDDFTWKLPKQESEAAADGAKEKEEVLKYVGGVDMSYCKDDPSLACAALVVLSLPTLEVVHQEYSLARLGVPYIPGFLAFREVRSFLSCIFRYSSLLRVLLNLIIFLIK